MKRMLWLILIPLALAAALLAAGCARGDQFVKEAEGGPHTVAPVGRDTDTEPDGPVDGGVTDRSDPDAPKTIESTQIVAFDCRFSTMDADEPGALGNHIYQLQAKLENGAVKGTYAVLDAGEEHAFRESHDFLSELQGLAEMYELAQYNGRDLSVAGIPDEFGARLDVQYASGEQIYAFDNQDNFLSWGAMNALLGLFERGAAVTPMLLPLAVDTKYESEPLSGGYADMRYPVYLLDADGYDALSAALAARNEARLDGAPGEMDAFRAAGKGELYHRTDAFVTRSDSAVVSFYERTERYESAGWEKPMTEVQTHNLDARTGKELGFADVFRDMAYLPSLLLMELESNYPQQTFYDDAADFIRQSVESGDGNLCFALGYGCVHVFANEYVLNDEPGGQHVTLSYVLHPELIRALYTPAPSRWMIPVDNDTVYWRGDTSDCFRIRSSTGADTEDVIWEVILNENTEGGAYAEPFRGSAPDCWLVFAGDDYYVYLRVPTGDLSQLTKVYRVTADKVTEIKRSAAPLGVALRPGTPLDPDAMSMNVNAPISSAAVTMLPYTLYRADRSSGLPQRLGDVYDLSGSWAALRESGRYNPASRDDAAASGGMWTLAAGELLRPYRTDLESWLDFITEDGRVVRFSIDRFADDMRLDNFGTLDDVFVSGGAD